MANIKGLAQQLLDVLREGSGGDERDPNQQVLISILRCVAAAVCACASRGVRARWECSHDIGRDGELCAGVAVAIPVGGLAKQFLGSVLARLYAGMRQALRYCDGPLQARSLSASVGVLGQGFAGFVGEERRARPGFVLAVGCTDS